MNTLVEKGIITEMQCGSNFAYVLSDNTTFLSTEYKVLQSQTDSSFVRCMKMLYNGEIEIFYLIGALKPLASMLPTLDADSFLTIVSNLLSDIIEVEHNGFLSCRNIDISFEKIYVDAATYKVRLIYLPVKEKVFEDKALFENQLRTSLVKLISDVPNLSSPQTTRLSLDLSNGTLSLQDLFNHIKGGRSAEPIDAKDQQIAQKTPQLHIVAMNAPTRVEITVTKDEFIIGKKPGLANGVISFNKMISRSHCKVTRKGNQYLLTDLQSANGTFVNRVRLQPNQPFPIKNGDVIRLANSDFQVHIG